MFGFFTNNYKHLQDRIQFIVHDKNKHWGQKITNIAILCFVTSLRSFIGTTCTIKGEAFLR